MGHPKLGADLVHVPQSKQGGEKLWRVARPLTKLSHASVSSLCFGRTPAFNSEQSWADGQLEGHFSLNTLAIWKPLNQIYRRTETANRISIRRALHRLLAAPP